MAADDKKRAKALQKESLAVEKQEKKPEYAKNLGIQVIMKKKEYHNV